MTHSKHLLAKRGPCCDLLEMCGTASSGLPIRLTGKEKHRVRGFLFDKNSKDIEPPCVKRLSPLYPCTRCAATTSPLSESRVHETRVDAFGMLLTRRTRETGGASLKQPVEMHRCCQVQAEWPETRGNPMWLPLTRGRHATTGRGYLCVGASAQGSNHSRPMFMLSVCHRNACQALLLLCCV